MPAGEVGATGPELDACGSDVATLRSTLRRRAPRGAERDARYARSGPTRQSFRAHLESVLRGRRARWQGRRAMPGERRVGAGRRAHLESHGAITGERAKRCLVAR